MSYRQHLYASTDFELFKMVDSNGNGLNVTWNAGDATISKDGAAAVNVTNTPVAVTGQTGVYRWEPTVSEATCELFSVNLTPGGAVENCIIFITGGDPSARLSG